MVDFIRGDEFGPSVDRHGSPLNVVCGDPMDRNIQQLQSVADDRGVDLKVYFARKSNKCIEFIDQARRSGAGLDTASENELRQCLDRGVAPDDIICTAAVKDDHLMDCCLRNHVCLSIDNLDELTVYAAKAKQSSIAGRVALRLGGFRHGGNKLWTRFGFDVDDVSVIDHLSDLGLVVQGIHFHLDGYEAGQRVAAIEQSIGWIHRLRGISQSPFFLDIGGGFPISYLDDRSQWTAFWDQHAASVIGGDHRVTYRDHPMGRQVLGGVVRGKPNNYPYYQSVTRQQWFAKVLDTEIGNQTVAELIRQNDLQLRCEPGRSLMDGCGLTITRVEYVKTNAAGDTLVGVSMNRTQCRTSSDDFMIDPIVVRPSNQDPVGSNPDTQVWTNPTGNPSRNPAGDTDVDGFFVGAYCTESELISLRRFRFPGGIARGDLVVWPNTAGYMMHFLESRSHQLPLAKNLVVRGDESVGLDGIDQL